MKISFEEFSKLPKKSVGKKNLESGKNYYIQESKGKYKTVYKGTYLGMNENGDYNRFENVEFVVNPFNNTAKPFGFNNQTGFIYSEVMEPQNLSPNVSFIGLDYGSTRDNYNSRKTKRSVSSTARGIKKRISKKKTSKKRNYRNKKN
jgi:hypothetical protein